MLTGLITLDDARASLNWPSGDTSNDADLQKYIYAVTPIIEKETGPMVQQNNSYTLNGGGTCVVLPVRFNTVVSVTEGGVTATDVFGDGASGIIYAGTATTLRSFVDGVQNIVCTVAVGYATIPDNVQLATRELVRFLWQQGRQGERPAGGFGDAGGDGAIVPMGFMLPNRIKQMLAPTPNLPGFA